MSFVDVLPVEPVMPTTRALARSRTARPSAASAANASLGHERRGGAARERVLDGSRRRGRRRRTGRRPRSRRESTWTPVISSARALELAEPAAARRRGAGSRRRPEPPQRLARDLAVVERDASRSANSWPCSWPLPAITTTSPSRRRLDRARDRRAPVGLDLERRPPAPATISAMIASRLLAARVVGGDDRDVGELGGDPAHHRPLPAVAVAAAAEDADHAACASSRAVRSTFSSASGVCE